MREAQLSDGRRVQHSILGGLAFSRQREPVRPQHARGGAGDEHVVRTREGQRRQLAEGGGQQPQHVLVDVEHLEVLEQAQRRRQLGDLVRVERDLAQREHRADERGDLGEPVLLERERAQVAQLACLLLELLQIWLL